jgi:8-oxo-dGTP pyrophosphatase MutT (NUDIX family)
VGLLTQLVSSQDWASFLHSGSSRFRRSNFQVPSGPRRVHVAAVCYRVREGELEFLLVRTRNGHWTFPKGGVDGDATHADAAAREAYEEAGVRGWVEHAPFSSYRHCKPRRRSRRHTILVHAHLCEVKHLVAPREGYRNPTWFRTSKAKQRLRKFRTPEFAAELSVVIDQATQRILGR